MKRERGSHGPFMAVGPPSPRPATSWLLVRQLKGAVWGQVGDPPACMLSQAHGEPGQGIVLGLWGNLLSWNQSSSLQPVLMSFVSSCGPWPLPPQAGRELCPRGGTTLSQVRSLQPV